MPQAPMVQLSPTLAPILPSAASAMALVQGVPGALPMVIMHTTLRAGIIGVGLLISGQRSGVVRTALVSSCAIESFVLVWAAWLRARAEAAPPPRAPSPGQ